MESKNISGRRLRQQMNWFAGEFVEMLQIIKIECKNKVFPKKEVDSRLS